MGIKFNAFHAMPHQPKLIFLNRYFYPDHSATSQLLSDLAFYLARQGCSVTVITSRQMYDDPSARLSANEEISGVQVKRVWTSRYGRGGLGGRALDYLTFYWSAAWTLWRAVSRGDVIVAKTDPPLISVIAAAVARIRRARLINWIQDLFPEVASGLHVKGFNGWIGSALKQMRNVALNMAETNVVIGDRMSDLLVAQGVTPDRITVIHNWSDSEIVKPVRREVNPLRRQWGLEDKFVVGYSGNMGRAHEFKTILDAAWLLREKSDIVFLFIGGGAQKIYIEDQVANLGLTRCMFQPYQPREQLANSLSLPDIHLISLLPVLEGLIVPSKFYGIAAAGRPTLHIGDVRGEIPRILKRNECGYAVPLGDPKSLAAILRKLSENREACDILGRNARIAVDKFYNKPLALAAWWGIIGTGSHQNG